MYSVHQHWDTLKVCVVGKTYPVHFFDFINDIEVRKSMQVVARETEEDLENLANTLQRYNVEVIRPNLYNSINLYKLGNKFFPPPMTPRDDTAMIGTKFFMPTTDRNRKWCRLRGESWPLNPPESKIEFDSLSKFIIDELRETFDINSFDELYDRDFSSLLTIENRIKEQGNQIVYNMNIDSAMTCRLGKDLYFGTWNSAQYNQTYLSSFQKIFPEYRCHIINTEGHLDGSFCPVAEGLIISNRFIRQEIYNQLFPDWEIFYVDASSPPGFKNWYVKGQENNSAFANFVNSNLNNWLGSIEDTTIDVNFLIVNPKTILTTRENDKLFKILEKYGITAHVVPFRHSTFWDGGLHCFTTDLHREGILKDYFPERKL